MKPNKTENELKGGVIHSEFFTNFTEKEFKSISRFFENETQSTHPTWLHDISNLDQSRLPAFRYKLDKEALEETIKVVYLA